MGAQMTHTITVGEEKSEETHPKIDYFGGVLKYFSDRIPTGSHPEADGEEGLLDVRVLEAVERALDTGMPQTLPPYARKRRPVTEQEEKLKSVTILERIEAHKPSDGQSLFQTHAHDNFCARANSVACPAL